MYRTIDASLWTDQKIRKLKPIDRLVFLYLITNPHTHVSGLYYLPNLIAQHETGLSANQLKSAENTLSEMGFCQFDPANELVWVLKMFRYQGKGKKNTLSAAHHIQKDIHNSFLINRFLRAYPEVREAIKIPYPDFAVDATPENGERIPENGERISDRAAFAAKQKQPQTIPSDFTVTDDMKAWGIKPENGFTDQDIARETPVFVDHFTAKGERKSDWVAAWRNWMRNSRKFGGRNGPNQNGGSGGSGKASAILGKGERPYTPRQ